MPAGTTAGQAVRDAELPGKGPQAVVVVKDAGGRLRDLAWAPDVDAEVERDWRWHPMPCSGGWAASRES